MKTVIFLEKRSEISPLNAILVDPKLKNVEKL